MAISNFWEIFYEPRNKYQIFPDYPSLSLPLTWQKKYLVLCVRTDIYIYIKRAELEKYFSNFAFFLGKFPSEEREPEDQE